MADLDKIEHHLSAEEFCRDVTAVNELTQFLNSETGRKLRRVCAGMHPLKQSVRAKDLTTVNMLTIAQAEQVNPQGVLGFQRGYEALLCLIEQTLTRPLKPIPPMSSKSKARISPHTISVTP